MTLIDAISVENNYTPIVDESTIKDLTPVMDSSRIQNLVNSILADYDLPTDSAASLVLENISMNKGAIKDELNLLTQRFLADLESSKDSASESSMYVERFFDDVKGVILQGLKPVSTSESTADSVTSISSEGLQEVISEGLSDISEAVVPTQDVEKEYVHDTSRIKSNVMSYKRTVDKDSVNLSEGSKRDNDVYGIKVEDHSVSGRNDSKLEAIGNKLQSDIDQALEGTLTSHKANASGIGSKFAEGWSADNIAAETVKPFVDLASGIVTELLEEPMSALAKSDAVESLANPFGFMSSVASNAVSQVMEALDKSLKDVTKSPIQYADEVAVAAKGWVSDKVSEFLQTPAEIINGATEKVRSGAENLKNDVLKILKPEMTRERVVKDAPALKGRLTYTYYTQHSDNAYPVWKDRLTYEEYSQRSDKDPPSLEDKLTYEEYSQHPNKTDYPGRILYHNKSPLSESVKRSDFIVNKDLFYMSNDMYWDITIVPHKYNNYDGPPSINKIYGCDSSGRLPIFSYTLDAGGLSNSTFEIYPGVSFSIPLNYSRPSVFSCAILNLVRSSDDSLRCTQSSCFDEFRDSYIEYVVGDGIESSFGNIPACLDYHYCAYEISVTKYSPQWKRLRNWSFLGIPQITVYEQGQSSSTQEIQNLNFAIVGGGTPDVVEAKKNTKKINPTNRENLEPEEGWNPGANRGYYEE